MGDCIALFNSYYQNTNAEFLNFDVHTRPLRPRNNAKTVSENLEIYLMSQHFESVLQPDSAKQFRSSICKLL